METMVARQDYVGAYSNVVRTEAWKKDRAAIVEKIKTSTNGDKSNKFANEVSRYFSYNNKSADFFIEASEIIDQAPSDGLITQEQAKNLRSELNRILSNEIIENPTLLNSSAIKTAFPDAEKNRDFAAKSKLNTLISIQDNDLNKYIPILNYFKSKNDAQSTLIASDGIRSAISRKETKAIENRPSWEDIKPIIEYIKITNDHSIDQATTNLIKQAKLSRLDLGNVKTTFPKLYDEQIAIRTIGLEIKTNGDSFTAEEISEALKKKNEWIEIDPDAKLKIDLIRMKLNEQRVGPTNMSETVSDLNFATLLFIPKNASVIFDYSTTEYSIQWNFRAQESRTKKSKTITGSKRAKRVECRNFRYQNVFGGTGSIGGYPNDNVANFCSQNSATDLDQLRIDAINEIAQDINDSLIENR